MIKTLLRDCHGVTMIEYALIAGLVGLVAVGILGHVGSSVKGIFGTLGGALTTA